MSTGTPNPPNPGDRRPSDGRMNAVLTTLKDALRPGDTRHQQNRQDRQLHKQHNPADNSVEAQHNAPKVQPVQQHEPLPVSSSSSSQQTQAHAPAFPEAHRDASGHTAVSESVMPGNQGLSGSAADQYPGRKERRGSGILGALSNMRRRSSAGSEGSASAIRDELGRRTSAAGSGSGNSGGGGGGGGDYTYDALSGTRSRGQDGTGTGYAARPRAATAGSDGGGAMGGHVAPMAGADETLQAAAGKMPQTASVGKERDGHDPVWRRL